jgi:Zn-finger nucleic acid-binding protein
MPQCPKCRIPLCRVEIRGVPVHTCGDCGGELIEELRLKAIERRGDPGWTESRKDELCRLADQSNDLDDVICPRCSRIMRKFLFRNYANLQVDQCPECKSYWLDAGEMEKMQILWHETRANMTEENWAALEAKGALLTHMDTRQAETREIVQDMNDHMAFSRHPTTAAGAGLGGAALATLAGLMHMDRRLQAMDDDLAEQATFNVTDDGLADEGFGVRRFLLPLLLFILIALAILAVVWVVRG